MREAVGEIKCPLCGRVAELHKSEERTKLDPEGGEGKPSYPKKYFVICPAVTGYRGCGTLLCNNQNAQARLMELGTIFGPGGKPAKKHTTPVEPIPAPPATPAPAPSPPPAAKAPSNPFKFW